MDDLQDIVESAADLLRAPATLEDRDFHLVAYAAHGRTIDPVRTESILHRRSTDEVRTRFERHGIARATGPVRIPADPEAGLLPRLCLPVRWNNVTYGYLWLLDADHHITRAMADQAAPLTERAALLMARQTRDRDDLGWKLADLLTTRPDVRAQATGELAEILTPPFTVAVLRSAEPGPLNPWLLPRNVVTTVWEGDHILVTSPAKAAQTVERARRQLLERRPSPTYAGLYGPCHGLTEIREGWLRARVAARTAADGETRTWESLGALRLLRAADDESLAGTLADLAPMGGLAETARTYLDLAGSVQKTAAALNVHRQTLYARLRRIEELTGLDLSDGRDRLTLHLALTLRPHLNI
ncbi:helix-turn-helix domain-containing protein [Spirillospora sp. NPDC029432]|uniref:PucR family transcriptional regulator n=1 Tax=Spirillospora sp. NPDC029432 TaxID=3154599 RepID=UPI003456C0DD